MFMTKLRLRKQRFQFFFALTLEFIRSLVQDNNWLFSVSSSNSQSFNLTASKAGATCLHKIEQKLKYFAGAEPLLPLGFLL